MMDPVGFAFENYDPVGKFRTTGNDVEIDTRCELRFDGELREFANAIEFVEHLSRSTETMDCLARKWLAYAYGQTLGAHMGFAQRFVTVYQPGGTVLEHWLPSAAEDGTSTVLSHILAPLARV